MQSEPPPSREEVIAGLRDAVLIARMQANPSTMIAGWVQIAILIMGYYVNPARPGGGLAASLRSAPQ